MRSEAASRPIGAPVWLAAVLILGAPGPALAQPLAFTAEILDESASGDDKLVIDVDLDGDGRLDLLTGLELGAIRV